MGFEDFEEKRPVSRGWWQLTAGVVGVVAATLGFGFYLPLRQGNQLLSTEFSQARLSNAALAQELTTTRATLSQIQSERDALNEFKTSHEAPLAQHKAMIDQAAGSLPTAVQGAVAKGKLRLTPVPPALHLDVLDPSFITPRGDGLTKTGRSLLCQVITQGKSNGLSLVTVRTFAPSARVSPAESRWAGPVRLASAVADALVQRCGVSPDQIAIGSSLETAGGAVLSLALAPSGNRP